MQNTIYTFPSGLKLAHKKVDNIRSVSLGVFFGVGSANETAENNGISHMIEHMMFKGTKNRSAFGIVEELEGNGIQVNAFTSKLMTCYYTISIDEEIEKCFDVLSDILLNSTFDEKELEKEKSVVLEEISISDDDPQDVCLELLSSLYYDSHALARPILGSRENVSSFTRDMLLKYVNEHYTANSSCISVVGNISLDDAKSLVEKYFEGKLSTIEVDWKDKLHTTKQNYGYKIKDVEQANFALSFPSYPMRHENEPLIEIINFAFGGGMSSRLFQVIREELGLAYSVYSYKNSYIDNGTFVIAVSTNPNSVEKALKAVKTEIDKLKENGFTKEEFERAKKQLRGTFTIGQESSMSMMRAIGRNALCLDKTFDVDELIDGVDNATLEDVNRALGEIFDYDKMSLSYVGREIGFNALERFMD